MKTRRQSRLHFDAVFGTVLRIPIMFDMPWPTRLRAMRSVLCLWILSLPVAAGAVDAARTFATPEDAVAALVAVAGADNTAAYRELFGPAIADLENPDRVQAANEHKAFAAAVAKRTRLVRESDTRCVLEVGEELWPFPVPIAQKDGRWFFDTEAGKDELLNRRIGRNELMTLRAVRAYVAAQREYAAKDRDGDEVLEYAQKGRSAPDAKDGLYWPPELDGEISPLGPLVARAHGLGYGAVPHEAGSALDPFNGYYFRILHRQGQHSPGGKYDYVINGNMIAGFALVAWPARYGDSGVMTFIVNHQGRVHEQDLGPDTAESVAAIDAYDPDAAWRVSED